MIWWIAGWYFVGLITMGVLMYADYQKGNGSTVREILLGLLWSWLGPLLALLIIYMSLRNSNYWIGLLNKKIIKGKKNDTR